MLNRLSPCKGCTNRHLGCHDHCDLFKNFKIADAQAVARRNMDSEIQDYESGRKLRIMDRMQRGARL